MIMVESLYMKTLVTHINPHLDDIAAIWLFKKYHPDFKDAKIEFISASRDAAQKEENEDKIFLGTGGGKFDEHKEDLDNTCAGTLVYEYLKKKNYIPKDEILRAALDTLTEWNRLIDTGRAPDSQFDEFSVQAFIRCKDSTAENSQKSVDLGIVILDRILSVLKRKQQSVIDWEKKVEFQTKLGKSFAVVSETVDREFCREQEGDLFLIYHPKHHGVQFFTPSFEIDLEPIYDKVKALDPDASWFLHQSHHMVICGSASAPDSKPTKLSFDELIEAAKAI
ncbi:MAG: hypothetical protein UT77_C0003G0046 [Candidatus Daviesbacteria bacterium GW2011_GWC2_40_12]|uniref:Uncharacterized protein n=1 Tax=Candidatus Daviesbacteria bacterium GW2011_GWC2_40_12 TaxID=1618431 RepID=A0A0G0QXT3_9BACT|nr:MAG: hypothetical protein UT04_C0060G0005 [Candidatus Daviesbacteria bacterium GW2011_GWF2_38_7]KKR16376.1 MAG: hypothetical protein UT45_C0006G0051 [Candidatus Daviesbacteria bacterium GW2011_GWA2_39_33]KKR42251.1 MAG: hypothetical protein UT77_C0003G0046 [Candidatus Daviesbacteria bacterium GW2011_GWC2_40_12]